MSWLIFLGNLAKIMFLDSHAKNLQVRTYLDVFLVSTMARSWQDLPRFSMFLSRCTKFRFTGQAKTPHIVKHEVNTWIDASQSLQANTEILKITSAQCLHILCTPTLSRKRIQTKAGTETLTIHNITSSNKSPKPKFI